MAVTFKQVQAQDRQRPDTPDGRQQPDAPDDARPRDETHVGVTPAARPHGGTAPAPKPKRKQRKTPPKPKAKGRAGAKPIYDKGVFDRVCAEVSKGKTLTEVLASDSTFMSRPAFYACMKANPLWAADYEIAQDCQRSVLADEVLTLLDAVKEGDVSITKNGKTTASFSRDRINLAKAKADNRKWLLSKLDPRFREQTAATITHAGRVDGVKTIVVTGGLPTRPLGELPPGERDAAVREAAKTRTITREEIENPFGLDIAAIEAQDALDDATEAEVAAAEAVERGPSPADLAVLARMSHDPADYDDPA